MFGVACVDETVPRAGLEREFLCQVYGLQRELFELRHFGTCMALPGTRLPHRPFMILRFHRGLPSWYALC